MSWVVTLTSGSVPGHFHFFAHRSQAQTQIDPGILSNHKADAGADCFRKSSFLHPHFILADRQGKQLISSRLVRNRDSAKGLYPGFGP